MSHRQEKVSTMLGVIAIVLWGTMIAAYQGLAEHLGVFTAMACVFTLGGGVGLLYMAFVQKKLHLLFRIAPGYLIGECLCVLLYLLGLNLALGSVSDPRLKLTIGVMNYLWPAATLLLAIPILRKRARWWLLPGMLMALSGVVMATFQKGDYSLSGFLMQWQTAWLPYLSVLGAAMAWGCYSNLTRRWTADTEISGMPLFLFVSGLIMMLIRGCLHEKTQWTPLVIWGLLYTAIGPTLLAYVFWDIAMRKGRMIFVTSLSYLTPLLSTLVLCLFLRIVPGMNLWIACALIITGAVICNASVFEAPEPTLEIQEKTPSPANTE